jgi:hypothetical protein
MTGDERLRWSLEILSYLVVVLGVPVAVYQHVIAKRAERLDRERTIFEAAWTSYVDFERLCLEYPDLDVFDVPDAEPVALTPLQRKQELIALSMLFSVFERAFLLYAERPTAASGRQWREWEVHIDGYLCRENVLRAWRIGESDYDPRFTAYVQERLRQLQRTDFLLS